MGQSLAIPRVIPNDWKRLDLIINKIKFRLGSASSPTFAGVTITGLTASSLIGTNASKALESVTIGTGLNYTRPTLSLSHLGIEALTDPNADKILFWDDSETACGWLGVGNSLAITTTTIDTIQDIRTSASPTFVGLTLSGIAAEATDVDKFLVDSSNVIKYRTGAQVLSDIGGQPLDAGLTSLAGLVYASDSFIKVTATDTYVIRTITETKTDLSLNLVENTAHSTDAHTMTIDGRDVSVDGTKLDGIEAGADVTATNETSHANVLVDGDFVSNGLMERTGAGTYGIKAIGTDVQAYHANLAAIAGGTWTGANSITTLGTIATGTWQATDVGIAYGGTGQSTAQLAINALTAVAGATNEHVLTKDTTTGNAIFKAAAGGGGAFTSKCSVYRSGTQTVTTETWTKVQLNAEDYDTDGEFDNATNFRFQPDVTGYYHVSCATTINLLADGKASYCAIYKNGSIWKMTNLITGVADWYLTIGLSCDMYLLDTDYIELYIWHNHGSDRTTGHATARYTFMDVHRFG